MQWGHVEETAAMAYFAVVFECVDGDMNERADINRPLYYCQCPTRCYVPSCILQIAMFCFTRAGGMCYRVSTVNVKKTVLRPVWTAYRYCHSNWNRVRTASREMLPRIGITLPGQPAVFHWHNPSGRTMALGSTQPLTEMSNRNISWGVKAAGA
jgi:hypothetical protein